MSIDDTTKLVDISTEKDIIEALECLAGAALLSGNRRLYEHIYRAKVQYNQGINLGWIALLGEPKSPGWPDPLTSPQAEAIRNGKIDDTEIRNLFDMMERELQLHRERNKT